MAAEARIQTSIVKYLKEQGYMVWKNIQISLNGFPDLTSVDRDGTHFYFEVKDPDGRLSEIQKYRIAEMKKRNLNVYVVTSVRDVKEILRNYDGEVKRRT